MLNKQCLQNVGQLLHNVENDFFVEAYAKWKCSKLMENGKKITQMSQSAIIAYIYKSFSI